MKTNTGKTMERTTRHGDKKEENLLQVVIILDKYLVEREYWLQKTSNVLKQ